MRQKGGKKKSSTAARKGARKRREPNQASGKAPKRTVVWIDGTRTLHSTKVIAKIELDLEFQLSKHGEGLMIATSKACGPASIAQRWADRNEVDFICVHANWQRQGKLQAPMKRDRRLAAISNKARFYWDGKSAETQAAIAQARAAGIKVKTVNVATR